MKIDIPTLFALVAMICLVVAALFCGAWLRDRSNNLALRAASGPVVIAVGVSLILARGLVPDWLSIVVANALLLTGLALIWSTIRVFEHRTAPLPAVFAGTVVWLVACSIPVFYEVPEWRIALLSIIAAAYSVSAAYEFWRGRSEPLQARMPLIVLCLFHAGVVTARAAAALLVPFEGGPLEGNWLQNLFMMEAPLFLIAGVFLGAALVRERAECDLRVKAETDELTGVFNRRAFLEASRALVTEAQRTGEPVVLLLFDLDHFKSINDRYGHAAGDRMLCLFAEIAKSAIRGTDVFGRIGGEEFAALLPGCDPAVAESIADRIRGDLAAKAIVHGGMQVTATVSVGVASMAGPGVHLDTLMAWADKALYESKRGGRDRVSGSLAVAG